MTPVSPFHLLNLPLVAIHDVLKRAMPIELIQLLSVSKKAESIVKSFIKRNSTKIDYKLNVSLRSSYDMLELRFLDGNYDPFCLCFFKENRSQYPTVQMKFDGLNVPVRVDSDNIFNFSCENDSTFNILRFLCNLFNPIISVSHIARRAANDFENEFLVFPVLDVLTKENARLDEVSITSFTSSNRFYQKLLDTPTRELYISSTPSDNFQYKPSGRTMKFEDVDITVANWVTNLEDFLHCKKVTLEDTNLKDEGINTFLKKWMVSDCQLQFLSINMGSLNLKEIVKQLPVEPVSKAYTDTNWQRNFKDGECFSFQRSNGEKAIIYQEYNQKVVLKTDSYRSS